MVGGNKRRFTERDFDLDLVYITDSVIGMSVPAVGGMSLYRNPIDEVARFFRTYHGENYMLFNCTSECVYPSEPFGGAVRRYAIDDHNVPLLEGIVAFCKELEDLSVARPGIVFAIHCRGGKGRTGTMVCSWLLWTRHCQTAEEALELFQRRRTDERIKGKWQGVETASQKRYVRYVEQYLAAPERVSLGRPRPLKTITVRNVFPDSYDAPEMCWPWLVISHFGPLGRLSLDTKWLPQWKAIDTKTRCASQSGVDIVFELPGHLLLGDVKLELYCEKVAGVAYLEMEARPPPSLVAGSAQCSPSGKPGSSERSLNALKRGSLANGFKSSAKSNKGALQHQATAALPDTIVNSLSKVESGGPGPPAPGADRQCIAFAWLHTSLEGELMTLDGSELDAGNGGKPLFKKLKQRNLAVEIAFGQEVSMKGSMKEGAPRCAALARAQQANASSRGQLCPKAAAPSTAPPQHAPQPGSPDATMPDTYRPSGRSSP